jgi:hypothetical protein
MRVILAALFVFSSMIGTVGLISSKYPDCESPWWATPAIIIVLFTSLLLSLFLFNRSGYRPSLRRRSLAEQIAELDSRGLLLRSPFHALRAFAVEEFEDEGSHYYIELADGKVLYLNGQYLYDFEPISDDPEMNQPRLFPCTEFEVLRHKDAGYVVDIIRSGEVLEPELTARPYNKAEWKRGIPEDGEIITDHTYEDVKRERTSG